MFSHRPQFPASHPRFLVRRRLLLFRIRLCRPQVPFLYRQFPVSHPQGRFFRRRFPVSRRQAGFLRRQSSAWLRRADFLHWKLSALQRQAGPHPTESSVGTMQSAVPHQQAGLWQPQAEFLRLLIYCDSSQSELLRRQSLLWRMQAGLRHPQSVSDKSFAAFQFFFCRSNLCLACGAFLLFFC